MRTLFLRALLLGLSTVAVAASTSEPTQARQTAVMPRTTPEFCSEVQRRLAGTSRPVRNALHSSYAAFKKSKPKIAPLEAQQYVQYEDAEGKLPMRISCKTKTADNINAIYGAGSASGAPVSCRDINRSTILGVWAAMPAEERQRAAWMPSRVMLDGDQVSFMGNLYIAPYAFLYLGRDGMPHVLARALHVDWDNWVWKWAPDRVRGTYYCHLIAPEYAHRLMRGEVRPAAQPEN